VLVPSGNGIYFDLVSGYRMNDDNCYRDFSQFPTLIRPGDRCEGYRRCRNTHGDPRFLPCVYLGYSGRKDYPFVVKHEYQDVFSHISPLPAADTNPLLTRLTAAEQELAAIRAEIARSAT
jgi:hypothetical protein